jgi:hypothetical protein
MKFKVTPVSSLEQHIRCGTRQIEVGKCFKTEDGHFYRQYENHVLHVNNQDCLMINTLVEGHLNKKTDVLAEITEDEFNTKVKEVIYKLELDTFWKENKKD